jgi:cytochrome oxidase Cu insertion factor (SCO1/SenC/PrrC family)
MSGRLLLAGLIIASAALVGCGSGPGTVPAEEGGPVRVGSTAPDFSLPAAKGGSVGLSDYRGKPVLLYFSMGPG